MPHPLHRAAVYNSLGETCIGFEILPPPFHDHLIQTEIGMDRAEQYLFHQNFLPRHLTCDWVIVKLIADH